MPRGYRYVIVAALGWLILAGPSYAKGGKADKTAAQADSSDQLGRIAAAIEKQPVATDPDGGCQPGHEDRQSDLCAQWKAADAAADSAYWTFWTFILSVAGLALGGGTLFAAWRAAHWAKEAAKETKRTADLAESAANESSGALVIAERNAHATSELARITAEHGRMGLRAYLDIVSAEYSRDEASDKDGMICVGFNISIKNFGNTPAFNVIRKINLRCDMAEPGYPFVDSERNDYFIGMVAKDDFSQGSLFFFAKADFWDEVTSGRVSIVVRCEVLYRDIFDDNHVSFTAYRTRGVVIERANGVQVNT